MRKWCQWVLLAGVLGVISCGGASPQASGPSATGTKSSDVETTKSSKASSVVVRSKAKIPSASEKAAKVVYLGDYSEKWIVLFGFETHGLWLPQLADSTGKTVNRRAFNEPLKPGDLFFKDAPMKDRFKFVRFEERKEMNPRLDIEVTLRYALFEDQKNGRSYEIPNRLARASRGDYYQADGKALLTLDGEGVDQEPFMVEEGRRFGIPSKGSRKAYLLKSVSPESVVVVWEEAGVTKSKTIGIDPSGVPAASTIREMIKGGE